IESEARKRKDELSKSPSFDDIEDSEPTRTPTKKQKSGSSGETDTYSLESSPVIEDCASRERDEPVVERDPKQDSPAKDASTPAEQATADGKNVNPTVLELEKKRTSLLQKLGAMPNMDTNTTSVLQDVGAGLRYGRYATTHKPKAKAKPKG